MIKETNCMSKMYQGFGRFLKVYGKKFKEMFYNDLHVKFNTYYDCTPPNFIGNGQI